MRGPVTEEDAMKTRIISALILLPIIITAIVLGAWPYNAIIALVVLLASHEYVQVLKRKGYKLSLPLVWALNLAWIADALWENGTWFAPSLAVLTILTACWILYRRRKQPDIASPTAEWALTLAGGVYLGIGGAYLLRMRALPDGLWWTLTALPIVWIGESAAYFFGRTWGQHKMASSISPGKSWEGYTGEVICGSLIGLLLGAVWPTVAQTGITLTASKGLLLGVIVSALTTTGDFFVSMIKREAGVKDTGTLIPGHGGVLDRIDSLLWTGLITWLFVTLLA